MFDDRTRVHWTADGCTAHLRKRWRPDPWSALALALALLWVFAAP